jgi:hypothetical protein
VIYLYAITDPGGPLPDLPGLEGAPLGQRDGGPVTAVFSRHEHIRFEPDPELLWTHDGVAEALMADRAVLPMRFGTCLGGEAELDALLAERGGAFGRLLDRVRGRVELSVRVTTEDPNDPSPATSGADYMMQRLRERRETETVARSLHAPLAELSERSAVRLAPTGGGVLTASYLVPGEAVGEFTGAVEWLQESHPALAVACTGPWPPYSFVGDDAG